METKNVNQANVSKESNIILRDIILQNTKRIINKIYSEQKDLFMNVYLPKILQKKLVSYDEYKIYDFINQQLTLSILNEIYEVNQEIYIKNNEYHFIRRQDEFLFELIDILHFSMQGMYITSEYVNEKFQNTLLINEVSQYIYYKKNKNNIIDEYKKYINDIYNITSSLPNYYNWKHWKKPIEFNEEYNDILFDKYGEITIKTINIFTKFMDLSTLEIFYDAKNKVNRDRQKRGY